MDDLKKMRPNQCEYGVGIMALSESPVKHYTSKQKAINMAIKCGVHFIVEFKSTGKKILAWDSKVKTRTELLNIYKGRADKLSVLNVCKDNYWLVLKTDDDFNHILPLSEVNAYEEIKVSYKEVNEKVSLSCVYGVGIVALKEKPTKGYTSRQEAIIRAIECGIQFIVEYKGNNRKILAWGSEVETRGNLLKQYQGNADKLTALNNCEEPYWLVLKNKSGNNHILPLSAIEAYEEIKV